MVTNSTAREKPGPRPASTGIRPTNSPEGAGTTGTRDDNPSSVTLPMVGAIPPEERRERRTGGPLDRASWARTLGQIYQLTTNQRFVLRVLTDFSDASGVCWPTWGTLAAETGLGRRTIARCIDSLVAVGAVAIDQSGRGTDKGNRYQLAGGLQRWMIQTSTPKVAEPHLSESPNIPTMQAKGVTVAPLESGKRANDARKGVTVAPLESGKRANGARKGVTVAPLESGKRANDARKGATVTLITPELTLELSGSKEPDNNRDNNPGDVTANAVLLSSDSFQESDNASCDWENESGKLCGGGVFLDFGSCLTHIVQTWWQNPDTGDLGLGASWKKGIGVAVNWYSKNPDALVEQIAALQDKAAAEDAGSRCRNCGEPFAGERMDLRNSGFCPSCSLNTVDPENCEHGGDPNVRFCGLCHYTRPAETGTYRCSECGETHHFPDRKHGELHRVRRVTGDDGKTYNERCLGIWTLV